MHIDYEHDDSATAVIRAEVRELLAEQPQELQDRVASQLRERVWHDGHPPIVVVRVSPLARYADTIMRGYIDPKFNGAKDPAFLAELEQKLAMHYAETSFVSALDPDFAPTRRLVEKLLQQVAKITTA